MPSLNLRFYLTDDMVSRTRAAPTLIVLMKSFETSSIASIIACSNQRAKNIIMSERLMVPANLREGT